MTESRDISDITVNLVKMFPPVSNPRKKYTLDPKISYTKCFVCKLNITFTKDAVVCRCTEHWYCSPQCQNRAKDKQCTSEIDDITSCNSLVSFYTWILHWYDIETLNMIKEYMRSKEGVSRIDIKKLAESGDWKAALVLGLTYEFRFVCESEECELAIRPPFVKSKPFSNRKAIKYYKMGAVQNSTEVYAALGRVLRTQMVESRAALDYCMFSIRYKMSQLFLYSSCFHSELSTITRQTKDKYVKGESFSSYIPGVLGLMFYRLLKVDSQSSTLREVLLIPEISKVYSLLKLCDPQPQILCNSNQAYIRSIEYSVQNLIFIQKADDLHGIDNTVVRIDPGVRVDAKAAFDPGHLRRQQSEQPMHYCEHDVNSAGNTCYQCAQLARDRILSVYENSFMFSRDESVPGRYYSVIFSLESGLKKHDYLRSYGKYEVIIAVQVIALQPMDLHPLQLAKSPNIYWPIIHYYGSVFAALSKILDRKTVDSIYENILVFTPLPERRNRVDEEKYVIKCGHEPCVHLDWKYEFKKCSRCMLRRYCSPSCQEQDWKDHKKICFLRPGMNKNKKERKIPGIPN